MSDQKAAVTVSIIIPVYNERDNLDVLYQRLCSVVEQVQQETFEFIFVDDGSMDSSWRGIEDLCRRDVRVRGFALSKNFGHQTALTCGMDYARGQAVIMMDADLQHPPELIPQFIEKWREGFDIVYSIRKDQNRQRWFKRVTARIFYQIFRRLSGVNLPQGAADFRLLSRMAVDGLCNCHERTRFLRGLVSWIGYRSIGITYFADARFSGQPKYSLRKMTRLGLDGIIAFSSIPLQFATLLGLMSAGASFIYGIFVLYIRLFTDRFVPGWTSILLSVLFLGGVQLISIGILGNYLAKVYEEVKGRPLYFVRSVAGSQGPG